MSVRDTCRYKLIKGGRVVYRGVTDDLDRRESQHREKFPDTQVEQVGRVTTRKDALQWLAEATQRPHRR